METFELFIGYGQFSVFNGTSPEFPLWNNSHADQGFVWKYDHVSFGVPDSDNEYIFGLSLDGLSPESYNDFDRLIRVPFTVTSQDVFIASLMDEQKINVELGDYNLFFGIKDSFNFKDGIIRNFIQIFFEKSIHLPLDQIKLNKEMKPITEWDLNFEIPKL